MAFAFTVAASGAIIANPLLPVYRVRLGLSWTEVALAFSVNLAALVGALGWGARGGVRIRPEVRLLVALGISLAADAVGVLARTETWAVFGSRALSGACVGIATGAAANLMVRVAGDRGRSLVALGSLVGAAVGLVVATLLVELLPAPLVLVYPVHGALVLVAVAVLAATARAERPELRVSVITTRGRSHPQLAGEHRSARPDPTTRPGPRPFIAAALAWAAGGVLVGYAPSVAPDTMGITSPVGAQASAFAFQGVAGLAGLGAAKLPRWTGLVGLVVGCATSAVGVALGWSPALLVGCALAGLGQAVTYTKKLLLVSAGVSPIEQGTVSSRYSQIAYCASAGLVLAAGGLGSIVGPAFGLVVVLAVIVAGSVLAR